MMQNETPMFEELNRANLSDLPIQSREEKVVAKTSKKAPILFGIVMFFVFLAFKLPEGKLQNLIIAHLKIITQSEGLTINSEKMKIGMITGPKVKLYNTEIRSLEEDRQSLKIPFFSISPHLSSLPFAFKKTGIKMEMLSGELAGTLGFSTTRYLVDLSFSGLNLFEASLLKKYILISLNGVLDGSIDLDLALDAPEKSEGDIHINLEKLQLPEQNIMGIQLPSLNISESKIKAVIEKGKLVVKESWIGKDIKTDDIVLKLSGDGVLTGPLERTQLNLRAEFEISNRITQKLPILESILSSAKRPNGKYVYRISGPVYALELKPGE